MTNNKVFYNAFNLTGKIGPKSFSKLLNHFSDLKTAWQASRTELEKAGLEEVIVSKILEKRQTIDPDQEFERLGNLDIKLLTLEDADYPKRLSEIHNPPALLYVRGSITALDQLALAVVGSRKMTSYGKRVTADLVRDLVRAGLSIVSGLALGTDAMAHQTALDFQGPTVGVLACGVDAIYPASNRVLGETMIAEGGAVISEMPLGTTPYKSHFPHRNRIISGLSLGTVVIEAASQSGALITAKHALEQNREVFAVPGSIYNPLSAGPNNLLKAGAIPAVSGHEILNELNLESRQQQLVAEKIIGDNKEEQFIIDQLSKQPLHVNLIVKQTGLPASKVASLLTVLEMKGKIKNLGANNYIIYSTGK